MVMSLELAIEALKELPEGSDITDAIDYLIYLQGIEEGLRDIEAGRVVSHEELLEIIKTWAR